MTNLEIEAKFKVEDVDSLKKKLLDLGLKSSGKRVIKNVIFDYPGEKLKDKGIDYLRLRKREDKAFITLKEPTGKGSVASVRKETEFEIEDFEKMSYILKRLGFEETFVYEKEREGFKGEGFEAEIDKTPFIGVFLEIEADSEEIFEEVVEKLGLKNAIKDNYKQLFEKFCKENKVDVKNMTFEEEKKWQKL